MILPMKIRGILLFFSLLFLACQTPEPIASKDITHIIPKPQVIYPSGQQHLVESKISWSIPESFVLTKTFLSDYLTPYGFELLEIGQDSVSKIKSEQTSNTSAVKADAKGHRPQWAFAIDTALAPGAYRLEIEKEHLSISAVDDLGAFYAVQSLRQLMPEYLEGKEPEGWGLTSKPQGFYLPTGLIKDQPKFAYRGMHLDVGRHFFGPDQIKQYIDYLALLKMNYFHWHLTEDQGWRIEIKSFPRLTQHVGTRPETLVGHYSDQPHAFDGTPYGGFYTQDEVKEIVAYAAQRHITVIPEIEMPGHAQAAISAYPELGCTGEAIDVATKWGIFEDIYCAKDQTFEFLESVLEEVVELFPGPYIHIGGDEAPKAHWESCANCQRVIQENGLADEHELQSYFITRIEAFINGKGKQIIGWDEILEGGLAPNATVMSWRGTQGGVEAAKQHHNVIMTPTSHCYFDYYQSDLPTEPLAIGGYLPLKKVYSYNPIPHELTPEEADYILGAQGNVWTEYMPTFEQVQYMVFPRILALSEVVWNGPVKSLDREYAGFTRRVASFFNRLDAMGVNYANHLYDIASVHRVEFAKGSRDQMKQEGKTPKDGAEPQLKEPNETTQEQNAKDGTEQNLVEKTREQSTAPNTGHKIINYALINPLPDLDMEYRLNQGLWTPYGGPIIIEKTSGIEARLLRDGQAVGRVMRDSLMLHAALGSVSSVVPAPHSSYNAGGIAALTNGKRGDNYRYGDSEWLGFWGDDVSIELDLKQATKARQHKMRFYHRPGQWIYVPKAIELTLNYNDGSRQDLDLPIEVPTQNGPFDQNWTLTESSEKSLESIEINVLNHGIIAQGAQGAGQAAWTFIDEIILE